MGEKSFTYTLKAPASTGTYKFTGILRDINKAEFAITPADSSITVIQPPSGGGGGGKSRSGGGGGAGASQEPQSNVEAKELSQKTVTRETH